MFDNTAVTKTNDDSGDPKIAMHETHRSELHVGHTGTFDVRAVAIAIGKAFRAARSRTKRWTGTGSDATRWRRYTSSFRRVTTVSRPP